MDLDKLARKAQQIYTKRGGAEAARGDAVEVEGILAGPAQTTPPDDAPGSGN